MAARKKRHIKKAAPKKKPTIAKVAQETEKESIEIVLSVPKGASVTSVSELPQVAKTETDENVPSSDDTADKKEPQTESVPDTQSEKTESDVLVTSEDALPVEGEGVENTGNVEEKGESKEKEEEVLTEELSDDEDNSKAALFKKIALWGGIAVVVGVLLGISWKLAYERGVAVGQEQMQAKQQSATHAPALSASPTPENIAKTKYSMKVLNGSGIDGEATRVKGIVGQAGYTVSSVGNASASDVETTTIQTKSSVEQSWIDDLKVVLSKSFVVSYSKDLDDSASTDVVVTVGSKKAE